MLTDYRDAISYVYDQTLRWINQGLLPDDLVEGAVARTFGRKRVAGQLLRRRAALGPADLRRRTGLVQRRPHHPRATEHPRVLRPLRGADRRARCRVCGGEEGGGCGDHQWAAELVSHLVRIDAADTEARLLKADALRTIGYGTPNSNWRNFYLTAARELDGTIDYSLAIQINAPDQIAAMPGSALLESLRFRIDPKKAGDTTTAIGFEIADTAETVGLIVRRGVLEVTDAIPDDATVVIVVPKKLVAGIVLVDAHRLLATGLESGAASLQAGTVEDANAFFDLFDARSEERLHLADR